jgi:hypothetical protein
MIRSRRNEMGKAYMMHVREQKCTEVIAKKARRWVTSKTLT